MNIIENYSIALLNFHMLTKFAMFLYFLYMQVIAKPGSLKTYKKFEAEIYVLTKEEGGRHTAFMSNYRPQFYMRTADITGKVELPENVKMVMPGDNVTAAFELISPVPLEAGASHLNSLGDIKTKATNYRLLFFLPIALGNIF